MNIQHHLSDTVLADYAAGGLGEAWSLLVATHAALCPVCRDLVSRVEAIGGALVDDLVPVAMPENAFADVLSRLDAEPASEIVADTSRLIDSDASLPEPLRSYVLGDGRSSDGTLPWQRLGLGAFHIPIAMQDQSATARMLRIPAGKPVPEHGHGGLELTLVLSGAFTDGEARFGPGDVEEVDEETVHYPHAVAGEDCICLAVTDAPLRFSSRIVRLMQPLLKI